MDQSLLATPAAIALVHLRLELCCNFRVMLGKSCAATHAVSMRLVPVVNLIPLRVEMRVVDPTLPRYGTDLIVTAILLPLKLRRTQNQTNNPCYWICNASVSPG